MAIHSKHSNVRIATAVFAVCLAAFLLPVAACPTQAFADVKKADVILGKTVEERDLSVAQCPSITSKSALVVGDDGTVYFSRNADEPYEIGSLAKIMTALLAMDYLEPDEEVSVGYAAAKLNESTDVLKENDKLSVTAAMTIMLLQSGSDAAVALADAAGDKILSSDEKLYTEDGMEIIEAGEAFTAMMNKKAAELGCTNTKFMSPHGSMVAEGENLSTSTASDLMLICKEAMKNQTIRNVVASGDTNIQVKRAGKSKTLKVKTNNLLPTLIDCSIGIKPGSTTESGSSVASAAEKDDRILYAVLLYSTDDVQRFYDAQTLFNWAFEHIIHYPLAHSPETVSFGIDGEAAVPVIAHVAHKAWLDKTIPVTLEDPDQYVEVFDLSGNISQELQFDEPEDDVAAGDVLGTITFYQRNEIIAQQNLVACEDCQAPTFKESLGIWFKRLKATFTGGDKTAATVTVNETPLIEEKATYDN